MFLTRWSTRLALAALVLGAAPALTVARAGAAPAPEPWVSVSGPAAFSPNADGRQDKAKFTIRVKKRAAVTVRVLRAGKVVRGPVKLGARAAGAKFAWTWNGRDFKGRRVPDGRHYGKDSAGREGYVVKVVARSLKTGKKVASRTELAVDTEADLWGDTFLVTDAEVIHPGTPGDGDRVRFQVHGGADWIFTGSIPVWSGTGTLLIRDAKGRTVREITSSRWGDRGSAIVWDGRDKVGKVVPVGTYFARLRVKDEVGNVGQTDAREIRVA